LLEIKEIQKEAKRIKSYAKKIKKLHIMGHYIVIIMTTAGERGEKNLKTERHSNKCYYIFSREKTNKQKCFMNFVLWFCFMDIYISR